MPLSHDDLDRHRRHILLKEIGGPGVQRLRQASVSIIGAGALAGPCALYLAAAGCGRIELLDDDVVERSNLQRQVQFETGDIGAQKVTRLAERLTRLDPGLDVTARRDRFGPQSTLAGQLLIDASDNYETRFTLNRYAHQHGRRLVSGAAIGWQGQVGVFASGCQSDAPCYQCLVPATPPDAATCEEEGVVGAVTGMTGARMALDAVKLLTGAGSSPVGRLWILDGLSGQTRLVRIRPDPDCPVCSA